VDQARDFNELPNMERLLAQAAAAQDLFSSMFSQMGSLSVTGSDGTGAVTLTMSAGGQLTDVRIDPAVVEPRNTEIIADMVHRALVNAHAELNRRAAQIWPTDELPG
jgi:nucleoid-associated protein EbfC